MENSSVRSLSTEAQRLYRQANAAYQKDAGRFYAYICIHSGRRSVQEQAGLVKSRHRSVHGVPSAPKANLPGTSIHEYGFAIDVIRGSDEARIVSALSGAGWTQHAGNEGWHFEAKSANNWSDLEDYIGRIRPNEPSALGGKIESGVLSEVELLAVRDYIARMTPVLESEKRELDRLKGRLDQWRQQLDTWREGLEHKRQAVERARRSADQAGTDFRSYTFTLAHGSIMHRVLMLI